MGFPTQVNVQPAQAVEGDFCDTNPRATVDAGAGELYCGTGGVTIGRFAWADFDTGAVLNTGVGVPTGFVHRAQQGVITTFLAGESMVVPEGLPITLFKWGGFWARNNGAAAATIGMKAYANNADGTVEFAAASSPPAGGTSTASTVAPVVTTASSTLAVNAIGAASISGTTLTVTTLTSGVLGKGLLLSGGSASTGYVMPGTEIVQQLTGTAGGTGTYEVSISQTVLSTSMTVTGGGLTVTTMSTGDGGFYVGQVVSGTGIVTGTKILAAGTGAGGAGTYVLDTAPTAGSSIAVTGAGGLLTVGGTVATSFDVGDVIHGSGVTAGSTILLNAASTGALGLTGAGGAGTYIVSEGDTISSEAIDTYAAIETAWYATSAGAVGELVKISRIPND